MTIPKVSERNKFGSPKFLPDHDAATRLQQGTLAEREAEAKKQGIFEVAETKARRDQEPSMGCVCFECGKPLGLGSKSKEAVRTLKYRTSGKPSVCAKCAAEARERMYALTGQPRPGGPKLKQLGDKCVNGHVLAEDNTRTLKASGVRAQRLVCITCETAARKKYRERVPRRKKS